MNHLFLSVFFCLLTISCWAQTSYQLQGKIVDKDSREALAGVAVYDKNNVSIGTTTDADGRFSLPLMAGKRTVVCSYIGYEKREVHVTMNASQYIVLALKPDAFMLEEVLVSSTSSMAKVSDVQIGVEKVKMTEMAKVPMLFGERDIIRAIQLLPGIKSDGEGSSGFQVRGGTADQNLVLLDDASIHNSGHLLGIFSAFNNNILSQASLYKGQIPAQFGGATSSVFDINTKAGGMNNYHIDGNIGLLSMGLNVDGPIVKEKVSFLFSARRTYLDQFLRLTKDYKNNVLNFYDINAKISCNITRRDKLSVSFFTGRDNAEFDELMGMDWGNTTGTIQWLHQFNDRLYLRSSAVLSSYTSESGMEVFERRNSFDSHIKQVGITESFTLALDQNHEFKFGLQSVYFDVKTAEWVVVNTTSKERRNAWENTAWLNEERRIGDKLSLLVGLRFTVFSALGGSPYYEIDDNGNITEVLDYGHNELVKTYFTYEPRLSLNYRFTDLMSIKGGYSRTSQNIQALRSNGMPANFNRYAMSSNLVKPQVADQLSLGFMALTNNCNYEFSAEAYFKSINNVLDYKDGKTFSTDIEVERMILTGKGRAYGAELYIRKNKGVFTGWISYTLSWSQNKISGINNNKWYTAENDRRHDFSVVGMCKLPRGWHASATWVYNTGQAITAPSAKYKLDGETAFYYAERNGYRAPAYHRLDFSISHTKTSKRFTQEWAFGVYNLYDRRNPFMFLFESDDTKPSGVTTTQVSLYGLVPSISYNFKF